MANLVSKVNVMDIDAESSDPPMVQGIMANPYSEFRVFLESLPPEQFEVELSFPQVEKRIRKPLPPEADDFDWWRLDGDGPRSPLAETLVQAGFGVSCMASDPSVKWVVTLLRGLHRWPNVYVLSGGFGELKLADRFRQMAYGHLESGKVLCHDLGESPGGLTFPRGLVVCHCCRHANELFYKSCILYKGGIKQCNHDIGSLKKQFMELYPEYGDEVHTWYDIAFDKNEDQVLRYFADRTGEAPKARICFTPGGWLTILECLEVTMNRTFARTDSETSATEHAATAAEA